MLRVGVIGVGSMGQNHARVFSEIGDLVGIADPNAEIGEKVSQRLQTDHFLDYKDLLKKDIDAVSIATPTDLHFPVAKDAILSGCSVLVEKPMASNLEEAKEMIRLARAEGVVLAVGHIERHNPVVSFVKRSLEDGAYGDVITTSARRVSSLPSRVKDVGVILDLGIHDIDVMRYFMKSDVKSVYATAGRIRHEKFEDHANILLTFADGATGIVEINWLTPMKVRELSLTCTKNFVEIDYTKQALKVSTSTLKKLEPFNLYRVPYELDTHEISLEKREPLKLELLDFLGAVEKGGEPLVSGEDAFRTMEVVIAAIRSNAERRKIDL